MNRIEKVIKKRVIIILISLPYRYLSVYHKKIFLSILWFNHFFILTYSVLTHGYFVQGKIIPFTFNPLIRKLIMAAKSTTKSQKDIFFEKLAQSQQQDMQQSDAKLAKALRDANPTKTTGVFINQGIFHPSLGVIALSNGMDSGYIQRKLMKFHNSSGELSDGQQLLAARQAVSRVYTDLLQQLALGMLESRTHTLELTPENISEFTEDEIITNLFKKYQLGISLVNANVERLDAIEVNQSSLAKLFV